MYKNLIGLIIFNWILGIQSPMSQTNANNYDFIDNEVIEYSECYERYRKNFVKPQFKNGDTTALCNLLTDVINPYLLTVPLKTPLKLLQYQNEYWAFWVNEKSIKTRRWVGGPASIFRLVREEVVTKIAQQCHDVFIKPGTLNGINVSVEVNLPVILTPDSQHIQFQCPADEDFRVSPNDSKHWLQSCYGKEWARKNLKNIIDTAGIQKLKAFELGSYVFCSTSLRWFIPITPYNNGLKNYFIDVGEHDFFNVTTIFRRKNVIVSDIQNGAIRPGHHYSYRTFPNEPIIIVAFKTVNGVHYVAVKETLPEDFPTLEFKELTPKLLEEIIKMIDREVGGKY